MNERTLSLCGNLLVFGMLTASVQAGILNVDMGPGDVNTVQSGFVAWSQGTAGQNEIAIANRTFTHAESGFGYDFTASLSSPVAPGFNLRLRSGVTGDVRHLAEDAFLVPVVNVVNRWDGTGTPLITNAAMMLTLSGLAAGPYDMTLYNHDGSSARTGMRDIAVFGTDHLGTNRQLVNFATQSWGQSANQNQVAANSFSFTANGIDDVVLYVHMRSGGSDSSNEVWLNGFTLAVIPEPGTLLLVGLSGLALMIGRRKKR
jgi:hypothetical protein